MRKSPFTEWVGGVALNRRSFVVGGIVTAAATPITSSATEVTSRPQFGEALPEWMKTPGGDDSEYGTPSTFEAHIKRRLTPRAPEASLFSSWHSPIANQRGIITPSGLHFSINHNGVPDIDPQQHVLLIHGLVENPLKFDVESLLRYPLTTNIRFIECAGNTAPNAVSPNALDQSAQELFGQISGAEWSGVPLKYLLREAGLKPNAKWVIAEGADGGSHARSIPVTKLLDDAIVALYQNGERLRPSQGYPMRLLLPGWEGNTNVKWLHRLEVTAKPAYTKDESGLYSDILNDGKIRRFSFHMEVKSVIAHPSGKQLLPERKGYYEISGLAWSGHGSIKKVEVSVDGGKHWTNAELEGPVLPKSLTRFRIPWRWDGRETVLLSRATDETGRTQPARDQWREKYASYSFNHYNAVQAWSISRHGEVRNTYV